MAYRLVIHKLPTRKAADKLAAEVAAAADGWAPDMTIEPDDVATARRGAAWERVSLRKDTPPASATRL